MKDVYYEIHKVHQRPPALGQPFDVVGLESALFHLFSDMFSNCSHVSVGRAAGDHETIRHIRDAVEIKDHNIVGFQIQTERGRSLSGGETGPFGRSRNHSQNRVTNSPL